MEYPRTKGIFYAMKPMGHKNIKNILIYVQIEKAFFNDEDEEFVCKVAGMIEEAKRLIEAGFSYVCEFNGVKLFRKKGRNH